MKILLAIDPSKSGQFVADEAAVRPWPAGSVFVAVHALDVRSFARFPAVIEDAKRAAAELVKTAAGRISRCGYKCDAEVIAGSPRSALAEFARDWGADLVMVGSRGHGAVERFLLGSVAQGILRTAPCSVEIVRAGASDTPPSTHGLKILLATDGSKFSTAAALSIARRPWPAGSQITIVSAEEMPVIENQTAAFPLAAVYPASLLEELLEGARKNAEEAVESARKIFMGTNLEVVSGSTSLGDPRSIILDLARNWKADVIVTGSHGRGGLDRMLMGSVSETVAIHSTCSVEVIRPADQDATEKQ
jgi:nucleotide-binding universal stress UspA family protein